MVHGWVHLQITNLFIVQLSDDEQNHMVVNITNTTLQQMMNEHRSRQTKTAVAAVVKRWH
jgi:hypothetical protein